ncbi:sugar fermentation stimulation protein A [Oxobacter pfennigii]|uniref:Sugar fermentation stimulation protein homolog n=1 Tax=Oxobacter pfennigii TaxID=36849 RepID=A0A0N8NSM0_9CLOT|nr:DNA/RNA nuclease SfsA [Oxobacter pfennigii]KPU42408.1 sugar fermentation stimulation protein A [Oxobacter pfennigii]
MKYKDTFAAEFIKRPNRFIAHVLLNGKEEIVHVKNTGRCREILIPGIKVILEKAGNPDRKTAYSLIGGYKGDTLINIDSQVPNACIFEGIQNKKIDALNDVIKLKREVTYKNSRFDIYFETPSEQGFIEIKGVTLEQNGTALFPDAPTERGYKHVNEMIEAIDEGYRGYIFFLIQMKGVDIFTPNINMDPEFSKALKKAKEKGVKILAFDSLVKENEIIVDKEIEVII